MHVCMYLFIYFLVFGGRVNVVDLLTKSEKQNWNNKNKKMLLLEINKH